MAASPDPIPTPAPAPAPPAWRVAAARLGPLVWAAVLVAVPAAIHFGFVSIPYDADTAYHVAVGRLIREHGLLETFPWTSMSWLADNYADKELLLHLLLAPLAGLDWSLAAKIVGTALGAGVLLASYGVLRDAGVRHAGAWALLPLAVSAVFLFRFSLVRPHLLSIALTTAVLWTAARGRLRLLALASALFPWSYVAWHLPLVLVAIVEGARLLSGERLRWRPAAAVVAGLAVGLALHPNAWNLVRFTWIVVVEILFGAAWRGTEVVGLGDEFRPFSPAEWLRWLALAAAVLAAALALAWRHRRADPAPLAFALAALAFGALTVRTARFAEYLVPLATLALALVSRHVRSRALLPAVAALALLYSSGEAWRTLRGLGEKEERIPPALAAFLRERIPPGAQVFTCDWGHTGNLMLALPDRRFLVALDPTLAYLADPERYRLWVALTHGGPPGTAEAIRRSFGARYVICFWDEWNRAFCDRLQFEPGVRTLLLDEHWNVYDLGEPGAP